MRQFIDLEWCVPSALPILEDLTHIGLPQQNTQNITTGKLSKVDIDIASQNVTITTNMRLGLGKRLLKGFVLSNQKLLQQLQSCIEIFVNQRITDACLTSQPFHSQRRQPLIQDDLPGAIEEVVTPFFRC